MRRRLLSLYLLFCIGIIWVPIAQGGPLKSVAPKERCPVCGMFVAKYTNWITQITVGNKRLFFDGCKDMFAYYFAPDQYQGPKDASFGEMRIKDYYSLEWIDARSSFFVVGSDVYGPMGHEFIPFSSRKGAENFLKDHHGKNILDFKGITAKMVDSMRHGQRMR